MEKHILYRPGLRGNFLGAVKKCVVGRNPLARIHVADFVIESKGTSQNIQFVQFLGNVLRERSEKSF